MSHEIKKKLINFSLKKQLKSNYSLYPLVLIGFLGISMAVFQSIRTLIRSPDVVINRKKNPKPWEKFVKNDGEYVQYKYFTTEDYKSLSKNNERPKD
jgi:hypothetical protein